MGHRHRRDADRRALDPHAVRRAISERRAAVDPHHRDLSGRIRRYARHHGHAGDRAGHDGHRQSDVHVVDEQLGGHGDHHADIQVGHQRGRRRDAGAEQGAGSERIAAERRSATGHSGQQDRGQHPDGRIGHVHGRPHEHRRSRQSARDAGAGSAHANQRRRASDALQRAALDARVARSRQAAQRRPDAERCHDRHRQSERAAFRRADRRRTADEDASHQRDHRDARLSQDFGRVRQHSPARQSGRLARVSEGCRHGRSRRRLLRHDVASERQARRRDGHHARKRRRTRCRSRRPCARNSRCCRSRCRAACN